jgi:ubiquinol-cytochrome c reductase cytochrome c subunit
MINTLSTRRRHPLAGLAVIAFALLIFGLGYAFISPTAQAAASGTVYSAQLVAQGKNLFENNCSTCHGISGQGQQDDNGNALGPSLVGVGAASVDFQVRTGRMPAANAGAQIEKHAVLFTQSESNAMAAYVASLAPGPAIPTPAQYNPNDPKKLSNSQIAGPGASEAT